MKLHIVSLILMCVIMAAFPAIAQQKVYDNGPINGNVDAWVINFGFTVSDSFTIPSGSQVNGLIFGAWLIPGDTISNIEVSIGSAAFGNELFDGFVRLTQSNCVTNSYGYNVCTETGAFNPFLNNGTYWLTLQNANLPSGDPVYWDENSGPSLAQENTIGTIPSEAFTLVGTGSTCTRMCGCSASPACGPPSPEPGSLLLFGSGIVGLAGMLRLKIRW